MQCQPPATVLVLSFLAFVSFVTLHWYIAVLWKPQDVSLKGVTRLAWREGSQSVLEEFTPGSFAKDGKAFKWEPEAPDALQRYTAFSRKKFLEAMRGKRMFFYGTSFLREIYFEFVKLLLDVSDLSAESKFIPSSRGKLYKGKEECEKRKRKTHTNDATGEIFCVTPSNGCNLPGPAGIDLKKCGMPANRTEYSKEYDITMHFQFKTYIYTDEADRKVNKHIKESKSYDYMFLGSCEWGRNRISKPELGYEEQHRRFLEPLFNVFKGLTVYSYSRGYNKSTKKQHEAIMRRIEGGDNTILVYDTGFVANSGDRSIPDGHGHAGPRTYVFARSMQLAMMHDALALPFQG